MKKETKVWLEIARDDFKNMEYMRDDNRLRGAILFAHQAVEKIIKGYITENSKSLPKRTHRIERLIKEAKPDLSEIGNPDVEELSKAFGWARYQDLSDTHFLSKKEIKKLLVSAEKIYPWVLKKLVNK